MFVLGAIVLALVALLSFGGMNFFTKPQRFVVFFNESIHGLDLGSPVKLRGVRVGRVVELNIRYDAKENRSVVEVICEFSRKTIKDEQGELIDVSDRLELQHMIERGLRAQLGVQGLATGLLFVELDLMSPDVFPLNAATMHARYAVVPAVPSAISEFQASLTTILSSFKRIDFPGLSRELNGLLVTLRKETAGLELAKLTGEWTKAGVSVNAFLESGEVQRTLANLNGAITDLKKTIADVDSQVQPAGQKLNEALTQAQTVLKTFNEAADSARRFISAQSGLGEEAIRTLNQLSDAAASVQRLTDFLERNPNALITGKQPPR